MSKFLFCIIASDVTDVSQSLPEPPKMFLMLQKGKKKLIMMERKRWKLLKRLKLLIGVPKEIEFLFKCYHSKTIPCKEDPH